MHGNARYFCASVFFANFVESSHLLSADVSIFMKPFLKSIAEAYLAKAGGDLGEYCFLFPNKRSGTFFRKYIKESMPEGMTMMAPVTTNITDFVGFLSRRLIDNNVDVVFTLYDVYLRLLSQGVIPREGSADDELPSFDSFLHWGSAVVADIDEVDRYCVDLSIFKNVRDYREISADFLTDSQRRVMREYFGYSPDPSEDRSLWKWMPGREGKEERMDNGGERRNNNEKEINRRFLYLWQMLAPLYEGLKKELDAKGLATTGGAYRLAADRVETMLPSDFPYRRIVAVGFNALSTSEFRIFKALQGMTTPAGEPFADFFWDAAGPVLRAEIPNSASKFVDFNIREFPAPDWALPYLKESDVVRMPSEMVEIASPSNAMQAKIAGEILDSLSKEIGADEVQSTRTAVVLPDENLLFPMLYSLGKDVDVNLTVGYPLRDTSVMTFVSLARRLMLKSRHTDEGVFFLTRDLRPFVAHPFVQAGAGAQAVGAILGMFDSEHLFEVASVQLKPHSQWLAGLMGMLAVAKDDAMAAIRSIDTVMKEVKDIILKFGDSHALVGRERWLDVAHIDIYRESLCKLADAMAEHAVKLSGQTALYLADRLLGGERVEFEGEPLVGLQVMGLLETRSLDFENLIIPSLNEGTFPRRQRSRTFIPDSMRRAYAMPPANYEESLFAYYFYRLISRARRVWLIYDSRSATFRTKGASRYLYQLRYLYSGCDLKRKEYTFSIAGRETASEPVAKTPGVMARLGRFLGTEGEVDGGNGSPRYLSASSLETFKVCGKKFYLQNLEQLYERQEGTEDIDPISQGNVIHNAMERLYPKATPEKPLLITAGYIRSLIDEPENVTVMTAIRRAFNTHHFRHDEESADLPLPGGVALVASQLLQNIVGILRHDLTLAPFLVLGTELTLHTEIPVSDTLPAVNVKGSFDRLDVITAPDGRTVMRIVDYKTGSSMHNRFVDISDLFDPVADTRYAFQLAFYAMILRHAAEGLGLTSERLALAREPYMEFYDVPAMGEGYRPVHLSTPSETSKSRSTYRDVTDYSDIEEAYEAGLRDLLRRLFDPEVPFEPTDDMSVCDRCHLRDLCGR